MGVCGCLPFVSAVVAFRSDLLRNVCRPPLCHVSRGAVVVGVVSVVVAPLASRTGRMRSGCGLCDISVVVAVVAFVVAVWT